MGACGRVRGDYYFSRISKLQRNADLLEESLETSIYSILRTWMNSVLNYDYISDSTSTVSPARPAIEQSLKMNNSKQFYFAQV